MQILCQDVYVKENKIKDLTVGCLSYDAMMRVPCTEHCGCPIGYFQYFFCVEKAECDCSKAWLYHKCVLGQAACFFNT